MNGADRINFKYLCNRIFDDLCNWVLLKLNESSASADRYGVTYFLIGESLVGLELLGGNKGVCREAKVAISVDSDSLQCSVLLCQIMYKNKRPLIREGEQESEATEAS